MAVHEHFYIDFAGKNVDQHILWTYAHMYRLEEIAAKLGSSISVQFEARCTKHNRVTRDGHVQDILHITVTFAKGIVYSLRENNYYDDSDFYAVLIGTDGKPTSYYYGTTRAASTGYAAQDATPDVVERYMAWSKIKNEAQARQWYQEKYLSSEVSEKHTMARVVKAYKPRSKNKIGAEIGDIVWVFWYGETQWGFSAGVEFIGGDKDGERTFLDPSKLERVNPEAEAPPFEDVQYKYVNKHW